MRRDPPPDALAAPPELISNGMMIWIVFACLAAAVVAALCWPVWRGQSEGPPRSLFDQAVFKDQLAEIDRDAARGLIAPGEAEAARNEIARRLIGADRDSQTAKPAISRGRYLLLPAAALVPVVALLLYATEGRPHLADVPLAWRLDNAAVNNDFAALIAKAERHLAVNPDDAQGWTVLAPAYRRLERYADAARAYRELLRIKGPDTVNYVELGEMLTFAAGNVDKDASAAFAEALKRDPKNPKARFYTGFGLKQQGRTEEALAVWQALRNDTKPDDPWLPLLEQEMASLKGKAPGLTDEQMQSGAEMSDADRQAMIQSMVEGLEQRLKSEPDDLEGWQRLMRARTVLGDRAKAKSAYETARQQFKDRPEAVAALSASARELGIE
jgi:cytochrome c-type biogenesis protein CcmH